MERVRRLAEGSSLHRRALKMNRRGIVAAMATVTKTDKLLREVLHEVREVRALVEPISKVVSGESRKNKKLPKWLQASLKDVEEGRTSGPYDTVEKLMADLNGPGK